MWLVGGLLQVGGKKDQAHNFVLAQQHWREIRTEVLGEQAEDPEAVKTITEDHVKHYMDSRDLRSTKSNTPRHAIPMEDTGVDTIEVSPRFGEPATYFDLGINAESDSGTSAC
jgi:hypothetical protein